MRIRIGLALLLSLAAATNTSAQARGVLQVWHGATGGQSDVKWAYNGRSDGDASTAFTRYVARGDSVCLVVPNAHPVFYSYSVAAETLSVQEQLPQAPMLLALIKTAGKATLMANLPRPGVELSWDQRYVGRLRNVAIAFDSARRVAARSDAIERVVWGPSSFRAAVDSIAGILGSIEELNGQSLSAAIKGWSAEARSQREKATMESGSAAVEPPLKELAQAKGEPSTSIRLAADSNQKLLRAQLRDKAEAHAANLSEADANLLDALDGYANELQARVESFSKTWSGAGATFRSCVRLSDAPLVLRIAVAKRDSTSAKARSTGVVSELTVVPKFEEPILTLTPAFSLSLIGGAETDIQVRNGLVVDVSESNALTPRVAGLLTFRLHQSGDDGSIVWRVGLGSNLLKAEAPLDRIFGVVTVGYRSVVGVGVGVGRVREPRLKTSASLGLTLPTGSTLESLFDEPRSKTGAFLLFNVSGADALSAIGKVIGKP